MYYTVNGELYHHGVQGQKWGHRNGPPYPLDSSISTGKKLKESATGKKGGSSGELSMTNKKKIKAGKESSLAALAIITATYVTPILITVGAAAAHEAISKGKVKKYKKERENAPVDEKTGLKLKTKQMSEKEDLKRVNSEYHLNDNIGHTNNCVRCSLAYELRRRGYDVNAKSTAEGTDGGALAKKVFNCKDPVAIKGYDIPKNWMKDEDFALRSQRAARGLNKDVYKKTVDALSKEPNTRGQMLVIWTKHGGGHSFVYQVDSKGKVTFMDAQPGQIYNKSQAKFLFDHSCATRYQRLDNADKINKKYLKEVVDGYSNASNKKSGTRNPRTQG